jgi:NhaP-type Na+/H+ or K+/H+ antiporter
MTGFAVLAGLFALYALFASRLERLWITAPMVFVVAGAVLGIHGVGLVRFAPDFEPAKTITELTLAVLLFADASTINLRGVKADGGVPARLLLVGLPLTIALGTVAAVALFPSAGWATAALVAAILAPTDAALGLAVVTNPAVPVRIRRALNVESGLNDGIATPFVTAFLALVVAGEGSGHGNWVLHSLRDLAVGLAVAIVVGVAGGRLLTWAARHGWTSKISRELAVLSLALLSFEAALVLHGNGFVAAFVAGILFGFTSRRAFREAAEFTETVALFASFVVWMIFGATLVGPVLSNGLQLAPLAYAALSLTVVRMLPVAVALRKVGFRRESVAFIGWFGPRGLASVVFTLLAVTTLGERGLPSGTLVQVATYTIVLSVLAHGLTATPLSAAYGARAERLGGKELIDVAEPRVRRRSLTA